MRVAVTNASVAPVRDAAAILMSFDTCGRVQTLDHTVRMVGTRITPSFQRRMPAGKRPGYNNCVVVTRSDSGVAGHQTKHDVRKRPFNRTIGPLVQGKARPILEDDALRLERRLQAHQAQRHPHAVVRAG